MYGINSTDHSKNIKPLNKYVKQYTILPLAHIHVTDTDYNVYISMCVDSRQMHIFKYNDQCCQYEIFDTEGEACKFIELPLPGTRPKYSTKRRPK